MSRPIGGLFLRTYTLYPNYTILTIAYISRSIVKVISSHISYYNIKTIDMKSIFGIVRFPCICSETFTCLVTLYSVWQKTVLCIIYLEGEHQAVYATPILKYNSLDHKYIHKWISTLSKTDLYIGQCGP